jgi:hypothetical protein
MWAHFVFVLAGMLFMFLLDAVFWPGRGWLWRQGAASGASPASAADAKTQEAPPWGRLEYVRIALERPEEFFTNSVHRLPTRWVFRNHTEQQFTAFLASIDLPPVARKWLGDRAHWQIEPRAIVVMPPPEIVLSLGREPRAKLYDLLAQNPENVLHRTPFRFRAGGFEDWFADCGLPAEKIDFVRQLTYEQQGTLCFADAPAFSQVATVEETKCLVRALWRVSTVVIKLRLDPKTDVDALLKYWDAIGTASAYRPLIESMSRVEEGATLDIIRFLPPFARLRLYTYPDPRNANVAREDCFWSAMNFFNSAPDERFFNPDHIRAALNNDYTKPVDGSKRFGDVLLLLGAGGQALHMCVYIADDIVFTKNGANPQQPWVLMQLREVLGEYDREKPFTVVTYRRKTPVPALQQISAAKPSA